MIASPALASPSAGSGNYHESRITTSKRVVECVDLNETSQRSIGCDWVHATSSSSSVSDPKTITVGSHHFTAVRVKVGNARGAVHCVTYDLGLYYIPSIGSFFGNRHGGGLSCDPRGYGDVERGVKTTRVGEGKYGRNIVAIEGGHVGCLYTDQGRMHQLACDWNRRVWDQSPGQAQNKTVGEDGIKEWNLITPWGALPCVVQDPNHAYLKRGRGLSCDWRALDASRRGGSIEDHQDGNVGGIILDNSKWEVRRVQGFYGGAAPICVVWFGEQAVRYRESGKRNPMHVGSGGISCLGFA